MASQGRVTFIAQEVSSVFRDRARLRAWLSAVAKDHGQRIGELNYVLMSDKELLKYNQRFLKHDTYTDVITFHGSQEGPGVNGDILMSVDRIRDNARTYGVGVQHELRRVMVHGLLHLLGHTDKKPAERAAMHILEDKYMARW